MGSRAEPGVQPDIGDPIVASVGVISDTHGSLHRSVHEAFLGVDHIVHAGDIGGEMILLELETIAPVTAVLGNTDRRLPGRSLSVIAVTRAADVGIAVVHNVRDIRSQVPRGVSVVVSGHT
nr:metallophosphoesterase family protein [Actinomycetota bacterium]